jgi:hypothetical protein
MGREAMGRRRWARAVVAAAVACSGFGALGSTAGAATSPAVIASPSPSPAGPPVATLSAVSCPSATSCFTVGTVDAFTPVIAHWNGTKWTAVVGPSNGDTPAGVSCATATSCVMVGNSFDGPVAQRWNGKSWLKIATPFAGSAVSCVSATSCLAVG